jgi:8-amino-7-oxononanoate synthase
MNFLEEELKQIEEAGLYRKLLQVSSQSGPRVTIDGKEMLMMASNDYLGLCADPRIKQSAAKAIPYWGVGSGASRLISGNTAIFRELEKQLAEFKQTEDALVFSTGYMANLGLLSTLAQEEDIIYSDELNHASIIDGCRLSRAKAEVFPHRNMDALESMLKGGAVFRRRIIVTDGVFSMDGDLAPLPRLYDLAQKYEAILIVDDAHATGVLGKHGGGTAEHFGLDGKMGIIMGTMGKAMGCFGAFIAGSRLLKEFLINRSRSFIFTTALPALLVASALEALQIIKQEPHRRALLWENVSFFRKGLKSLGFNTLDSVTQIIPLWIGEASLATAMARHLMQEGLFIQAIRPPTIPEGSSRLRITVMATHTREDLDFAIGVLAKIGRKLKII